MKSLIILGLSAIAVTGSAANFSYVNWHTLSGQTVLGTITLPDLSTVNVTYFGDVYAANLNNTGVNYYSGFTSTYTSPQVQTMPTTSDMIAMSNSGTNTLTFDRPVTDVAFAIVSLGNPPNPVDVTYSAPSTVVSSGPGWWGSGNLFNVDAMTVRGEEGSGTVLTSGTFTSMSFLVHNPETWHGFTVGIAGAVPEPSSLAALGLSALIIAKRRRRS